jgi:hypothetical protein
MAVKPGLTEREVALSGPRVAKQPGSVEWCWQTVDYLKNSISHVSEQWAQAQQVIEELKKTKAWQVIPPEQPYGAFDALLKEELGFNEKQINEMIANAELAANGGDRRSKEFQFDNIKLKNSGGTSDTYTLRRLRRDYKLGTLKEDLAAQVESGELSANAAAIQAGWRPKTFTVRADDPVSIAKTLRRQLDPEVLGQLIKELQLKGESE